VDQLFNELRTDALPLERRQEIDLLKLQMAIKNLNGKNSRGFAYRLEQSDEYSRRTNFQ